MTGVVWLLMPQEFAREMVCLSGSMWSSLGLPVPEWLCQVWYGCEGWVVWMMGCSWCGVCRSMQRSSSGGESWGGPTR